MPPIWSPNAQRCHHPLPAADSGSAYVVVTLLVTTPDPVLEDWRWTEFDKSSGLAGSVRTIYEDRDGNAWSAD